MKKYALVTGADHGVGFSLVENLIKRGYTVIACQFDEKEYETGKCMDFSKDFGWPDIDFTYMLVHLQRRCGKFFDKVNQIVHD